MPVNRLILIVFGWEYLLPEVTLPSHTAKQVVLVRKRAFLSPIHGYRTIPKQLVLLLRITSPWWPNLISTPVTCLCYPSEHAFPFWFLTNKLLPLERGRTLSKSRACPLRTFDSMLCRWSDGAKRIRCIDVKIISLLGFVQIFSYLYTQMITKTTYLWKEH